MGHIGIHAHKEPRCLCHACQKTCSATTGTALSRLRTAAETVRLGVTWLAPGGARASDGGGLGV
jgi:transposase-like protein